MRNHRQTHLLSNFSQQRLKRRLLRSSARPPIAPEIENDALENNAEAGNDKGEREAYKKGNQYVTWRRRKRAAIDPQEAVDETGTKSGGGIGEDKPLTRLADAEAEESDREE